jgi:hypothetical protein
MNRTLILIAGAIIFVSGTQGAAAFSTRQVDPVTTNDRLADPGELADKMSNEKSGGNPSGLLGGHMTLQFTGPQSGMTPNSPFVTSPSTVFVPSEHR